VNQDRFKQRYIISTDEWCDGCPIFFYCGNEGDIFMFANNTGFMWENAKQFNAMVLFPEHRYYGQSIPYGKLNRNLSDIGYLTTEQALADFAEFLQHIKDTVPGAQKSPVVVFGGSYGGMLAAWFRIKYPHMSVGALAGSAPILQFPGIDEYHGKYFCQYSIEYYQEFTNAINTTISLPMILKNIRKNVRKLFATLGLRSDEWPKPVKDFNGCQILLYYANN
jgi:lysosomal Pro-X carboxypeptidase